MTRSVFRLGKVPPPKVMWLTLVLVGIVGSADYLTGYEISISIFYLVPIGIASWIVSARWASFLATASIASELWGDSAAGIYYSNRFVFVWNAVIKLVFYLVVVWLVVSWRLLHRKLEERVLQRTNALTQEMLERERLEKELLEVVERERRRIGQDLHDSLCQHLTGIALAGQVLNEKLRAKNLDESAGAQQIVTYVEEAIELTRTLSRGLHPVALEEAGLSTAFRELASVIADRFQITCECECPNEIHIGDIVVVTHLYRIAQESISNAIKHGKAFRVIIKLLTHQNGVTLLVEDNGQGLPNDWRKNKGMGMRIMAHRAAMIGGEFIVKTVIGKGTIISCSLKNCIP